MANDQTHKCQVFEATCSMFNVQNEESCLFLILILLLFMFKCLGADHKTTRRSSWRMMLRLRRRNQSRNIR